MRRTRPATGGFEDGGRKQEPRNAGGLQEEARKPESPLEAPERMQQAVR